MPIPKVRYIAFGLATAGALVGGLLLNVGHSLQGAPQLAAAEPAPTEAPPPAEQEGNVRVHAPAATVNVDKEHGKVTVRAPHTDVDVDPERGRVQVRAPYVNLDIRW